MCFGDLKLNSSVLSTKANCFVSNINTKTQIVYQAKPLFLDFKMQFWIPAAYY